MKKKLFKEIDNRKILVSIICVTYNQENYIEDCLKGFLIQETSFRFEVIISDDASTDKTPQIIREYSSKYPNIIKPIFHKSNIGMAKNFYQTMSLAKSEYIAFCDGDDYWVDKSKLQLQIDFLENNKDYGLVYTNVDVYDENSKLFRKKIFWNSEGTNLYRSNNFEDHLVFRRYIAPLTWVFRNNLFQKYADKTVVTEPSFMVALEFFYNSKIKYIDKVTGIYRMVSDSASHPTDENSIYDRKKNLFYIQIHYVNKYKVSEKTQNRIYGSAFIRLLPSAIFFKDKKTIKAIVRNFKKFIFYLLDRFI